jgi:hypothetical protein
MTTTTRRVSALALPLLVLQLAACSDSPLAPAAPDLEPQFLIGQSPLAPVSLAKAPVLETRQAAKGQVDRQLVVELHMAASEADALEEGKRAYESSAGFWIDGDAIALADPRPSPIAGLFDEEDGNKLVVIAMPLDDATWLRIDAAAKAGQAVDVAMHIDLLGVDARGGTYLVHGIDAAGSFTK